MGDEGTGAGMSAATRTVASIPHVRDAPLGAQRSALSTQHAFIRRFARNRVAVLAAALLLLAVAGAVFAPLIARNPPERILGTRLAPPSERFLLGTDQSGRDVFARLLYGGQVSLMVGFLAAGLSIALGASLGAVAGYARGWPEAIIMRVADGMLSIPIFFLVLVVLASFGSTLLNLIVTIGLASWMTTARVVRGEVLRASSLDFVTAARALGASAPRVLLRHALPQALPSTIVAASLGVAQAILTESALSYLGLGVQPPTPSWGNMLTDAQSYVFSAPLLALWPGLAILLTVLSFNFLGESLRDALDPFSGARRA
jgi:peptide/nickel transport system permease protein